MRRRLAMLRVLGTSVALVSGQALADGLSAHLEPGYLNEQLDVTDQAGRTTHRSTQGLSQNYELLLDEELLSQLRLSTGGLLRRLTTWTSVDGAAAQRFDDSTGDYHARLLAGTPTLQATASAERRERFLSSGPLFLTDVLGLTSSWRPLELPEVDLQLSRTRDHQSDRPGGDATSDAVLLGVRYAVERLDVRYRFDLVDRDDRFSATESRSVEHTVQAAYASSYFDQRTQLYATGTLTSRGLSTTVTGPGGLVEQRQSPIAGLSLVEALPALPSQDTLVPNPALVDGDLGNGTTVDLGYAPSLAGDRNPRDLGAQFGDLTSAVNTFYVVVDRLLPPAVSAAYAWTAWRSDDNLHWTELPLARPASFDEAQLRFVVPIQPTRARYLKVVTAPLPAGVTTDRRYADLFVTELQLLNVVPAASLPREQSSALGAATVTLRTVLLRGAPEISYDVSAQLSRLSSPALTTWSAVNGLSYHQRVSPAVTVDARVDHRDQDNGDGHRGQAEWSGSVVARPLPALYHSLTYSGLYDEQAVTVGNSVNFYNRAEIWEGVNAQANIAGTWATLPEGRASVSVLVNPTVSLVPSRLVSLSAGWLFSRTKTYDGLVPSETTVFQRVDATATVTPAPALSATGSVSRVISGTRPTTLAGLQVSYAPLQGELQLSVAFSQTLDTAADSTSTLLTPSLRWNIRHGLQLNVNYSLLEISAPAQTTRSRALTTSLVYFL